MQEGIHPEYGPVVFYDRSADKYFLTKSTLVAKAVNLVTGASDSPHIPQRP